MLKQLKPAETWNVASINSRKNSPGAIIFSQLINYLSANPIKITSRSKDIPAAQVRETAREDVLLICDMYRAGETIKDISETLKSSYRKIYEVLRINKLINDDPVESKLNWRAKNG